MKIIELKNISKTFIDEKNKELLILKDINLEIKAGEFFVFLGPSGSGKSTLLRIMSGLEKDYSGTINLNENTTKSDFAFIFQQFALLPWLTVYKNIEIALTRKPFSNKSQKIEVVIKNMGLEKFAGAYPRQLSGGMKQRVGIARALVASPKVIFMDEPFSSLDSFTAKELRQEILTIWQKTKTTMVMVTHLISEAIELADRIAVLSPLPGKIQDVVENNLIRPRQTRSDAFYQTEDKLYQLIKN